jgi:hypothetical protein
MTQHETIQVCWLPESELLALVKVGSKQNYSQMDKPTRIHVRVSKYCHSYWYKFEICLAFQS